MLFQYKQNSLHSREKHEEVQGNEMEHDNVALSGRQRMLIMPAVNTKTHD